MYNFYSRVISKPPFSRQLRSGESLFTLYNCGLKKKYEDLWSHHNYIMYVAEGRKVWHTAHGSYDIRPGDCVFVRKGAAIVEQFFDSQFCLFLFFIPDDFICDVLKNKTMRVRKSVASYRPVMNIDNNAVMQAYFQSMMSYFDSSHEPDAALIKLKFCELILTIADNPSNSELTSFFYSLFLNAQKPSLLNVMEENYCFNLKLGEFARLSSRSLSAFKRDFQKQFHTTPGKWLLEKRLQHAMHLLSNCGRTVSEAAFESGFQDASHFSRCFRSHFGMAPMSVRQQLTA